MCSLYLVPRLEILRNTRYKFAFFFSLLPFFMHRHLITPPLLNTTEEGPFIVDAEEIRSRLRFR
jgi:hypothetical protein